jgi:ABC-type Fe3+-hydroxamate transport system substrate-binding protein
MRISSAILALAAAGFLTACNSEEECTEELATKKLTELQTKMTELAASDPAKMAALGPKVTEIMTKAAGEASSPDDVSGACKAIDDIMVELNK